MSACVTLYAYHFTHSKVNAPIRSPEPVGGQIHHRRPYPHMLALFHPELRTRGATDAALNRIGNMELI